MDDPKRRYLAPLGDEHPEAHVPLIKRLGPGLITGAADDDPSGIATYSQAGAQYGYGLLSSVLFTTPLMIGIQVISARIGRVTGHGLAANIREHFPRPLLISVVALLLFANTLNIAADLGAMGNALEQARAHLRRIKLDTYVGMIYSNVIALCIMLTTAVTLHASGMTDIATAEQAAPAPRPIAGPCAFQLFALGIIGTGLLAVPVLAGSAAYAVAESLRWPIGLGLTLAEARGFYLVLSIATLLGVAIDFYSADSIRMLVWAAMVNGVIAVPIMGVMMLLAAKRAVMGPFVVSGRLKALGWLATAVMAAAVVAMVVLL